MRAGARSELPARHAVSIHAPRHRGAMRYFFRPGRLRQIVFNPRPPSPRGDAPVAADVVPQILVSIHAPRHRGAMPRCATHSRPICSFQSTPPVTEGRCQADPPSADLRHVVSIHAPRHRGAMHLRFRLVLATVRVSIHAPRHRGAMRRRRTPRRRGRNSRFNPRPPSPRGDAWPDAGTPALENKFQSTPPVTEGRCHWFATAAAAFSAVSIHAPRHRGAMPMYVPVWLQLSAGFNPRPPSPRGDARPGGRVAGHLAVSIHAPRHRGAMRSLRCRSDSLPWFQSTPPVTEGRCTRPAVAARGSRSFQSTPPVTEGRCSALQSIVCGYWSFNPRPPSPRGDACPSGTPSRRTPRFNPRPPSPRGDAISVRLLPVPMSMFQSTPPVTEGRCERYRRRREHAYRFNPRPPSPRGDALVCHSSRCVLSSFNPRPPSPRGDAGSGLSWPAVSPGFNPRPPSPRGDAWFATAAAAFSAVSIHAPRHRGAMHLRRSRNDVTDRHKGAGHDRRNGATWRGLKVAFRTVRRMG